MQKASRPERFASASQGFANVRQSTSLWARMHKAEGIARYLWGYRGGLSGRAIGEARCHLPLLLYFPCSIVDPALPRCSLSLGLSHRSVLYEFVPEAVVCASFAREDPRGKASMPWRGGAERVFLFHTDEPRRLVVLRRMTQNCAAICAVPVSNPPRYVPTII